MAIEEYFSIELKVTNRDDPLVQAFLQQFSGAMVRSNSQLVGLPEVQVIACGWDPVAGAMTKCDAYEQHIADQLEESAEDIVLGFLEAGEENAHDR